MTKFVNPQAFAIRKFPTFGRGQYSDQNPPPSVTQSPFYWWFKFLCLNDEYQMALKGKNAKINKSVLKDLGNPNIYDFKTWWRERSHLFAEPPQTYRMKVAQNISEIAPFNNSEVINLVVPLNWTNVGIKRSFARVIDKLVPKVEPGNRGVQTKLSGAKFKIGRKWSISAFESAYKVYVEKQKAIEEVKKGGKNVSWADIGIRAELSWAKGKNMKINERGRIFSDHRKTLTIITLKHYKRALSFIKASSTQKFP
jgi:hypothetical protein